MKLFPNGIVIQGTALDHRWYSWDVTDPSIGHSDFQLYQGIGRYRDWPLEFEDDPISKILTREAEDRWFYYYFETGESTVQYALWVVPEKDFIIRYISHCNDKNINIRILFCFTGRMIPIWGSDLPTLHFLGYDYVGSDLFSVIPDDLLSPPYTEYQHIPVYKALMDCAGMLNKYKLFETENDVNIFIERRNDVIKSKIQSKDVWVKHFGTVKSRLIEEDDNLTMFKLFEVVGELL